MFSTKEIRWFSEKEEKDVINWFEKHGLNYSSASARSDIYMSLPGKDDLNIKLREGKIEIKQRKGKAVFAEITDAAEGYFEDWIKWSFSLASNDLLSKAINNEKRHHWTKVEKLRLAVKLFIDESGNNIITGIDEHLESACQIEYTRLRINGQYSYTFGLEWYGKKFINLRPALLQEIQGNAIFRKESSMSYAGFLK